MKKEVSLWACPNEECSGIYGEDPQILEKHGDWWTCPKCGCSTLFPEADGCIQIHEDEIVRSRKALKVSVHPLVAFIVLVMSIAIGSVITSFVFGKCELMDLVSWLILFAFVLAIGWFDERNFDE